MSISKIFIPNFVCVFSQIKDRKHIEQNFILLPRSCPWVGFLGAGGVKNFSVGICDGAPSTARSSFNLFQLIKSKTDCTDLIKNPNQRQITGVFYMFNTTFVLHHYVQRS